MHWSRSHNFMLIFITASILLHIIFSSFFLVTWHDAVGDIIEKKPERDYVPAYTTASYAAPKYQIAQQASTSSSPSTSSPPSSTTSAPKPKPVVKDSYATKSKQTHIPISKSVKHLSSNILASTFQMLQNQQIKTIARSRKNAEPMLLIGDHSDVANPFMQLLSRALSAYFNYPEFEGRMGIHGRVVVELTLHPEGNFDEIEIVQSSNNENLDAAALQAINRAPRFGAFSKYIHEPKRLVIGFIFS